MTRKMAAAKSKCPLSKSAMSECEPRFYGKKPGLLLVEDDDIDDQVFGGSAHLGTTKKLS